MSKKLMIGAAVGLAVAVAAAAYKKGNHEPGPTIWEKMREGMEQMPEDFPPRVMYDNIEATKANTERILELLEAGRSPGADTEPTTTG